MIPDPLIFPAEVHWSTWLPLVVSQICALSTAVVFLALMIVSWRSRVSDHVPGGEHTVRTLGVMCALLTLTSVVTVILATTPRSIDRHDVDHRMSMLGWNASPEDYDLPRKTGEKEFIRVHAVMDPRSNAECVVTVLGVYDRSSTSRTARSEIKVECPPDPYAQ